MIDGNSVGVMNGTLEGTSGNSLSNNEPADYIVDLESGQKTETVHADSFHYDESSNLVLTLAGQQVAIFRWWSGIRVKESSNA